MDMSDDQRGPIKEREGRGEGGRGGVCQEKGEGGRGRAGGRGGGGGDKVWLMRTPIRHLKEEAGCRHMSGRQCSTWRERGMGVDIKVLAHLK